MKVWVLVFAWLQAPTDTVTLDIAEALTRGLEASPVLEVAGARVEAAGREVSQAGAWPNPLAGVSVENLGQSEEFTGVPGWRGLEGQAVLTVPLPVGKERSGGIRVARAQAAGAAAAADLADLTVRADILGSIGDVLRDQVLAATSRDEAATLGQIAEALALQAEAGRGSAGDAARARLALGMAATRQARREATLAISRAELARRLGYDPGTVIALEAPVCATSGGDSAGSGKAPSPEVRLAQARVQEAVGATHLARGRRTPDFAPQVGVRRSGGETGLYVGLATILPIFDRGSARIDAALARERAAEADLRDAEERWSSARTGAGGALRALGEAGRHFDAGWFASLDAAVEAAEARYRLGEGTLYELLDSRRARLQALDDYHEWQAQWWRARMEVERLDGGPVDASILCTDPYLEAR